MKDVTLMLSEKRPFFVVVEEMSIISLNAKITEESKQKSMFMLYLTNLNNPTDKKVKVSVKTV